MLPTLLSLSSFHAPQLVAGLVVCGAVLLIVSDHRLAILAFFVQRLIVVTLLWAIIEAPLRVMSIIALAAIALVCHITEWRLRRAEIREPLHAHQARPSLTSPPFRALAAALGLLVAYGLVQTCNLALPLPMVAFTVGWLVVNGLLILSLAGSGLRTGLGVLTFADGCRILYALWQPSLLVWGLWSVCDVLVALAACHLRSAEVAAAGNKSTGGRE